MSHQGYMTSIHLKFWRCLVAFKRQKWEGIWKIPSFGHLGFKASTSFPLESSSEVCIPTWWPQTCILVWVHWKRHIWAGSKVVVKVKVVRFKLRRCSDLVSSGIQVMIGEHALNPTLQPLNTCFVVLIMHACNVWLLNLTSQPVNVNFVVLTLQAYNDWL